MNILLIGKPASGKGHCAQSLKKTDSNFVHLSTGDLLREEVATGSQLGNEIKELLKDGGFATDEMIFKMVEDFLKKNNDKQIIFDGFPRNLLQAEECVKRGINFDIILEIQASDDLIKNRILNRRVHPSSGRVYNLKFSPPLKEGVDDVTGEPLVQRDDDRLDIVEKRLKNYRELTEPIISFFKDNGYTVSTVSSESASEKVVGLMNVSEPAKKKKLAH